MDVSKQWQTIKEMAGFNRLRHYTKGTKARRKVANRCEQRREELVHHLTQLNLIRAFPGSRSRFRFLPTEHALEIGIAEMVPDHPHSKFLLDAVRIHRLIEDREKDIAASRAEDAVPSDRPKEWMTFKQLVSHYSSGGGKCVQREKMLAIRRQLIENHILTPIYGPNAGWNCKPTAHAIESGIVQVLTGEGASHYKLNLTRTAELLTVKPFKRPQPLAKKKPNPVKQPRQPRRVVATGRAQSPTSRPVWVHVERKLQYETNGAALFQDGESKLWLPKSQIFLLVYEDGEETTELKRGRLVHEVQIPDWLAEQKELPIAK